MPNKMLIDASHPEETRVVVLHGSRIEEFDFESQDKKQLKGNIYLARVTRVEPSLQAAFVEYGGNRHGFLAFSEIHPDYYQIPVADRQALLRAEAEAADEEEDEVEATGSGEERQDRNRSRRRRRGGKNRERNGEDSRRGVAAGEEGEAPAENSEITAPGESAGLAHDDAALNDEAPAEGPEAGQLSAVPLEKLSDEGPAPMPREGDDDAALNEGGSDLFDDLQDIAADSIEFASAAETDPSSETVSDEEEGGSEEAGDRPADNENGGGSSMAAAIEGDVISEEAPARSDAAETERGGQIEEIAPQADETEVESVGAEDALEEVQRSRRNVRRSYKIQEVIKRRQILLVQVVKEERGNKGAALTTYLSLAGRYSVLMPNTARGGGISRKITNIQDRKRLKEVVEDLEVPQGMGVILRTAGESRTKAEIKRDYEYLMRMWETVRNLTLASTAPALVYEEGSLIKRSVRDLYNKDIDEVIVAGDEGYREAKDFMRMLMPSHAKVVQPYRDTTPLFARNGIDAQLDRMLQPQVTLKSGGYIIINQTEALVSIDVNSGRSTREHSIEDTALQTNLEASEEVARQLRLRDLAGLIVIDYIDMEENRNNRAVEKKLKDCLKNDRARIQVGRISHFGLMEMSRQRIRASVLESTMKPCPQCGGTGHIRSDSSVALFVVRGIEEFLLKDSETHITVRTPVATALYVLNHKRSNITEMEARFGVKITVEADETVGAQHFAIFRGAIADKPVIPVEAIAAPAYVEPDDVAEDEEIIAEDEAAEPVERDVVAANDDEGQRDRKRRRRKRKRGGRDRDAAAANDDNALEIEGERSAGEEADEEDDPSVANAEGEQEAAAPDASDDVRKKRRRGKRGGKRSDEPSGEADAANASEALQEADGVAEPPSAEEANDAGTQGDREDAAEPVKKPRRSRAKKAVPAVTEARDVATASEAGMATGEPREGSAPEGLLDGPATEELARQEEATNERDAKPARASRRKATEEPSTDAEPEQASGDSPEAPPSAEEKPKRGGWWQRRSFF